MQAHKGLTRQPMDSCCWGEAPAHSRHATVVQERTLRLCKGQQGCQAVQPILAGRVEAQHEGGGPLHVVVGGHVQVAVAAGVGDAQLEQALGLPCQLGGELLQQRPVRSECLISRR